MIKNKKGVTLVVLVITVIVLIIIAGISIQFGREAINDVRNKKVMTELSNVQQAIFERYTLLKSAGADEKIAEFKTNDVDLDEDINRPKELLGTRIVDINDLEDYGFTKYEVTYYTDMFFEEYYYLLDKSDLDKIGINSEKVSDKSYSYIVNYSTGEVFDIEHTLQIDEYDEDKKGALLDSVSNKIEENKYDFAD